MQIKKSWIFIGITVLILLWGVSTRNALVLMDETINNQWAQVENQMQRRYDLIPNLVNTAKGISKQEKEVFLGIAEARSKLAGAASREDKIAASNQMESALSRLLVVVEQYPTLKSSESFNKLMDELAGTENRLSVERKRYNTDIADFNKRIKFFPSNIVASLFGFDAKAYFQINESARENVKVEF